MDKASLTCMLLLAPFILASVEAGKGTKRRLDDLIDKVDWLKESVHTNSNETRYLLQCLKDSVQELLDGRQDPSSNEEALSQLLQELVELRTTIDEMAATEEAHFNAIWMKMEQLMMSLETITDRGQTIDAIYEKVKMLCDTIAMLQEQIRELQGRCSKDTNSTAMVFVEMTITVVMFSGRSDYEWSIDPTHPSFSDLASELHVSATDSEDCNNVIGYQGFSVRGFTDDGQQKDLMICQEGSKDLQLLALGTVPASFPQELFEIIEYIIEYGAYPDLETAETTTQQTTTEETTTEQTTTEETTTEEYTSGETTTEEYTSEETTTEETTTQQTTTEETTTEETTTEETTTQQTTTEETTTEETTTPKPPCQFPAYRPWRWNAFPKQCRNNCYNYATNTDIQSHAQPGRGSGMETPQYTTAAVKAAIQRDGLVDLGFPVPIGTLPDPGKGCLIALFMWEHIDFHFMRLDNNGLWSHKMGAGPATNRDRAGNLIIDPQFANMFPYGFRWFFSYCKPDLEIC